MAHPLPSQPCLSVSLIDVSLQPSMHHGVLKPTDMSVVIKSQIRHPPKRVRECHGWFFFSPIPVPVTPVPAILHGFTNPCASLLVHNLNNQNTPHITKISPTLDSSHPRRLKFSIYLCPTSTNCLNSNFHHQNVIHYLWISYTIHHFCWRFCWRNQLFCSN